VLRKGGKRKKSDGGFAAIALFSPILFHNHRYVERSKAE